jgi:hypothetical protein
MFSQTGAGVTGFYPFDPMYSCEYSSTDSTRNRRNALGAASTRATISVWVKRANLSTANRQVIYSSIGPTASTNNFYFGFGSTGYLKMFHDQAGVNYGDIVSQVRFYDCSNWYHLYCAINSNEAVSADRCKFYVNGVQLATTINDAIPLSNAMNTCREDSAWGYRLEGADNYFQGRMSQACYVHDSVEPVTTFGEFKNGIWIPKDLTTLAANFDDNDSCSSLLTYSNSANLGEDSGVFGNDYTQTNMASDHQHTDNPTNNQLTYDYNASSAGLTNRGGHGGRWWQQTGANNQGVLMNFLLPKTGKWYWETKIWDTYDSLHASGIMTANDWDAALTTSPLTNADDFMYMRSNDTGAAATSFDIYRKGGSAVGDDNLPAPSGNKNMMIAVDMDNGLIWFGWDGTWGDFGATGVGNPAAGTNEAFDFSSVKDIYDWVPFYFCHTMTSGTPYGGWSVPDDKIENTIPTGFKLLNAENLPQPDIGAGNASKGFGVITYTGDGVDDTDITGLDFTPDLVILKSRDDTNAMIVTDSERGAIKTLITSSTAAEDTDGYNDGWVSAFIDGGFTVAQGSSSMSLVNANTVDYVAWCWKKSAQYGFDIQLYEGTGSAHAESHNLGGVPEFMIVKNRESAYNWAVYHHHAKSKTDPETDYGWLNLDGAWTDGATVWNDTAPTSTQFTVGTAANVNENLKDHVAYLWRSIPGFSKVGSIYSTSLDALYAYCDFTPKFVMLKSDYNGDPWLMYDRERQPGSRGGTTRTLAADSTAAESDSTIAGLDFYSNGFRMRNTSNAWTYQNIVYIAFAEVPFKYSNAI